MAKAAEKAMEFEPKQSTLTWVVPLLKSAIAGGSALMKRPDLCGDIVSAVKKPYLSL